MLNVLFGWLVKGGASRVADRLANAYEAKLTAQTDAEKLRADVTIKTVEQEAERHEHAARIRVETKGFWEIRLAVGIAAVATSLHYAMVVLDSIFLFPFDIAKLPSPMNEWQGQIILSFFGLQAAMGLGTAVLRGWQRR